MRTIRVTSGPGTGEAIDLDHDVVVGREGADLTIPDPELSRRHVAFRPSEEGVVVEDLGSTNGTMVNGERITDTVTLFRNATVKIGQSILTLELESGATVMRASPTVLRSTRSAAPAGPPPGAPAAGRGGAPAGAPPAGRPPAGAPAGGPPGGAPAGGPPGGAPVGGPPGGGPPGGGPPGGGPPGGRPPGAPGARPAGRKIPEFVPWLVAAAAIAVAVIVAITSSSTSKAKPVKPPRAVNIQILGLGNLQPGIGGRTMPNGVKLAFSTTGTTAVQIQMLTLQPGASEPWHVHLGSGLAVVQSGSVNDYEQSGTGCKLFVVSAHEARFDNGTNPHSLVNVGKVPAVVLVTGWAPVGQTAALLARPKPPNCKEGS